MRKFRVGIIGCGFIAEGKHMPALKQLRSVEMVAFCDKRIERAEKARNEYAPEGVITSDYQDLLSMDLDAVHVCTPNKSHAEISIAFMEAGKHVLCEKPMAISTKEAKKMVEASKKNNRVLTIGYQNRFRADSIHLKEICKSGGLGEIYLGKAHAVRRRAVPTWGVFLSEEEQGGGPLIDIGTHALDMTLWFMDNYEPLKVTGSVYKKLSQTDNQGNAFGDWDPKEFTVEDSAFAFVTMKNGATIVLESSWALNTLDIGEAKSTLCGTKSGADMNDGLRINGVDFNRMYVNKPDLTKIDVAYTTNESDDAGYLESKAFYECILENKEPVVKPEEALVVTKILEAIYESADTGKEIYFD